MNTKNKEIFVRIFLENFRDVYENVRPGIEHLCSHIAFAGKRVKEGLGQLDTREVVVICLGFFTLAIIYKTIWFAVSALVFVLVQSYCQEEWSFWRIFQDIQAQCSSWMKR